MLESHSPRDGLKAWQRSEGKRRGDEGVLICPCVVPRSPCPRDAPRSLCCPAALPASPTSPAPPPPSMAHICDMENCAHGTHCLTVPMRTILASFQPSRTKRGRPGNVPRRQCRCRGARALGVRVHGSIHQALKPVTASVACAGRARRPALLHVTPFRSKEQSLYSVSIRTRGAFRKTLRSLFLIINTHHLPHILSAHRTRFSNQSARTPSAHTAMTARHERKQPACRSPL
jgi:hypothetical protein